MPTSSRLRAQDVRAVHRLVGDCRDLGDDPGVWRRHFVEQLAGLVGAGIGNLADWDYVPGGPRLPALLGINDWGWHNGFDRRAWDDVVGQLIARGTDFHPALAPYYAVLAADNGVCLTRADLVLDADWYGSTYFQDYHRRVGGDTFLYCHILPRQAGETYRELTLARPAGEADFRPRDRAVVREAHAAVAALIGGPLAGYADPAPSALRPRARDVLKCLLEGDSDKQVAARLGLTRHTVNQYTKMIHRHFRVRSRTELLARWVKRGWGGRFAWADDPG